MAITADSIADDSSTMPANAEAAPTDEGTPKIPEEVLALPIMRGLLEGAPAAVWAPIGTKGPEVATVLKHGPELIKAGFGFYRDDKAKLDLFFNRRFISPELIEAAAKKGKLKEVASPLEEVSAAINGAVGEPAGVVEPGAAAGGVPSSVPVDSALNTQRVNNLSPGGPTSGPQPGGGRVLNQILTPTV
jgi:hypothetical protein